MSLQKPEEAFVGASASSDQTAEKAESDELVGVSLSDAFSMTKEEPGDLPQQSPTMPPGGSSTPEAANSMPVVETFVTVHTEVPAAGFEAVCLRGSRVKAPVAASNVWMGRTDDEESDSGTEGPGRKRRGEMTGETREATTKRQREGKTRSSGSALRGASRTRPPTSLQPVKRELPPPSPPPAVALPFDCAACENRFPDRLALASHERSHGAAGEPAVKPCGICGRVLVEMLDRMRHARRHRLAAEAGEEGARGKLSVVRRTLRPNRGITRCGGCGDQLSGRALREHFLPRPQTGFYPCVRCATAFAQACQLAEHLCESSVGQEEKSLARLGKRVKRRAASPDPTGSASPQDEFAAEEEPDGEDEPDADSVDEDEPGFDASWIKTEARQGRSAAGRRDSDEQDAAKLKCERCGKRFATPRNLSRHELTHEPPSHFQCEVCDRGYSRLDALVRHSVDVHQQEREFPCSMCKWKSPQQRIMDYHMKTHEERSAGLALRKRGRKPRPHRCASCRKSFVTKEEMSAHECRMDRAAAPAYVCDICGKSIKTKMWLSRHRLLHVSERPVKCEHCGQGFIDDQALQRHVRYHVDGRRFLCDICGKGFALKVTLQVHSRTHTGERPFACETCGKRFVTRTQLHHHSKIHSGEKPYVCPVCSRGFRQSHHLKTHMKVHGERPPPPEMVLGVGEGHAPAGTVMIMMETSPAWTLEESKTAEQEK